MTREQAKEIIRAFRHIDYSKLDDKEKELYDNALDTVFDVIKQEPCEDAISRSEVDKLCNMYLRVPTDEHVAFYEHFVDLPSVTPAREKGKWIEGSTEQGAFGIRYTEKTCSKCGWSHSLIIPQNYCPKCGTEMEVSND